MLAEQRLEIISRIINSEEFVRVDDLAKRLNVSAMTIRRDLRRLDELGLVQRKHGGAVSMASMRDEKDYQFKKSLNLESKKCIARIATEFINTGDILYLDGGTTTFELATLLSPDQYLTVITNDLKIASELSQKDINTLIIGGQIQGKTETVMGAPAIDFLKQFRVTNSFIGTSSVNKDYDVLSPTTEKAYLKKIAISISDKSYLLADNSKFYSYSLNKFAHLSDFVGVITDFHFSELEQKKLSRMGINIISSN